jgi:hypothetical protein
MQKIQKKFDGSRVKFQPDNQAKSQKKTSYNKFFYRIHLQIHSISSTETKKLYKCEKITYEGGAVVPEVKARKKRGKDIKGTGWFLKQGRGKNLLRVQVGPSNRNEEMTYYGIQ